MAEVIPYLNLQKINAAYADELKSAAGKVIDSGWYLHGYHTQQFESEYAKYIGTRHCVCVGNGLDALTIMLKAYKQLGHLHDGDEVIVPANTFIATILAITENRLVPVLVEPSIETFQIDDRLIEAAVTPRTRAIMLVHLYGKCAYTERIADIAQRHDLLLFEDNAQAAGCYYLGEAATSSDCNADTLHKRTGSLGDCAAHSFYPGKNLGALGDAGAITTNDEEVANLVRSLANYGSSRKYVFPYQGRNSRIDELQAAFLSVKLRHLDAENKRRREIAQLYYDCIAHNTNLVQPSLSSTLTDNVFHIFPILSDKRDHLQAYLRERGIETMIHYPIPPHKQECYKNLFAAQSLPITERIAQQELSLPLNSSLSDSDIKRIITALSDYQ